MDKKSKNTFELSFRDIDRRIRSIRPKISPSLSSEILYYMLLSGAILIQYFSIFKMNVIDYNLKIICYSLLILMFRLSKKMLKYGRMIDPTNKYGFEDVIQVIYYISFIIPILMMWDLFEEFSKMKIILIVYYYVVNFVLYLTKDTNRKRSISLVQEFKLELRTVSVRLIEVIYFIFFLPLATRNSKIIETSNTVMLTYNVAICSMANVAFFLFFNSKLRKVKNWKIFAQMSGFWREITLVNKRSKAIPFNLKNGNYSKGTVVSHDKKFYEFLGYYPNKKFKYFDEIIHSLVTKDQIYKYLMLCGYNCWIVFQIGMMATFFPGYVAFFQTVHLLATLAACYIVDRLYD